MLGDPWPEEPDDPYEDPGDAESTTIEVPDPGEADVPKELFRAFWGLVAVLNIGLFALALGLLLISFRGDWLFGGVITTIGIALLGYGIRRYLTYRESTLLESGRSP